MNSDNTNIQSPDDIPFEIAVPEEINANEPSDNNDTSLPEKEINEKEDTAEEANSPQKEEDVIVLLKELSGKFDKKIAVDTHKNELFDKMYAELSSYKTDIYSNIMKPIIMDLIMYIDDTNKILRDIEKDNAEKIFKILKDVPGDLLEVLERNGVEAFHENTEIFNARTQRVLKTVPTDDPEMDDKIESRIRQGYKWNDKVIKPEMIQCYKYSQNK